MFIKINIMRNILSNFLRVVSLFVGSLHGLQGTTVAKVSHNVHEYQYDLGIAYDFFSFFEQSFV